MKKYITLTLLVMVFTFTVAQATHSWGGFHWARTANPFLVKLGDNLSINWKSYLATSSSDWSVSSIFDTGIVKGANKRNCGPISGRAEICNSKYGNNGWLGIASIWINGSHITQGTVKMNDTYFGSPTYNTPAWKNLVMCQEVGHIFGLDHQDENFSNAPLGTCMDYTSDPEPNQHPNIHDYDMLESIYVHLDTITTLAQSSETKKSQARAEEESDNDNDPKKWGKEIKKSKDGRSSLYEKDFGSGIKVYRHVFWAEPINY